MAKLNVSPTRSSLLDLKKRIKKASSGHRLLKEKRDGLMKQFMDVIREAKSVRIDVEKKLSEGFKGFMLAGLSMHPNEMKAAFMLPSKSISLSVDRKNVMSVNIPQFAFKSEGDVRCYGYAQTSGQLDRALILFEEALEMMIKLAEIEKSAELLAEEIEKTRRRVNALEHVMIPNLKETIKYIRMKLGEQERASITTVMKVKEMLSQEA